MVKTDVETKKVLIVEDETDVADYLEMLLRDAGYQTLAAHDGAEGIELARREKPDLVTLDIVMPESTGARFYKEIRSDPELATIPVVIVTAIKGYGGDEHGYEKFISGRRTVPPPDGFFPKPIDKAAFLDAVNELLS
jgi:CheY-like chemotaxis protein